MEPQGILAAGRDALANIKAGLGGRDCVPTREDCIPARDCGANSATLLSGWAKQLVEGGNRWLCAASTGLGQKAESFAQKRWHHVKLAESNVHTRKPLDLKALNPSLFSIGLETVEKLLPRYLDKAGIACERMQHAALPPDVIRLILSAVFTVPAGETRQSEEALRSVFAIFDSSYDGFLDYDEFMAVLPLLGEDVPPEVLAKLFTSADVDKGGTLDGAEFVDFLRATNPITDGKPDGWRALLPETATHFEETVLVHVGKSGGRKSSSRDGKGYASANGIRWQAVPPSELEATQRSTEQPYSMSLLVSRADLANVESVIVGLRGLGFADTEVRVVTRALFVTNTDEDYAQVFRIFDRNATGGIDPFEFRATMALLGDHSSEAEARELFLDADADNDGVLDVAEFVKLMQRISPKAHSAAEAHMIREEIMRERLRQRISTSQIAAVDPATSDAMVRVLVLGGSKAGKTYLLNQVLAEKLPKGFTVAVGVGALQVRIGSSSVAMQVLDTPGDPRFSPLSRVFYSSVHYALLVYDCTSFDSFEALEPLLSAYREANPQLDPAAHICLVSNFARLGVKRAVSPGYAVDWCRQHGGIPLFEVDAEAPQGILEPLQHLADEFVTANPPGGSQVLLEAARREASGESAAFAQSAGPQPQGARLPGDLVADTDGKRADSHAPKSTLKGSSQGARAGRAPRRTVGFAE